MNLLSSPYLVIYAYLKNFGSSMKPHIGSNAVNTFAGALSALLLLIISVLLVPFVILRFCVNVVLKLKYGESYGGLLMGADTIYEAGQCTVVNIMIIYSCMGDKTVRIENLKKLTESLYQTSYKFSSIIQESYGFLFFLKNQVNPEEVLEIVDRNDAPCITETMLHDYIEKHCSSISSNRTWKVTGFIQPINWSQRNDHTTQYVTILTFRHSIGDGLTIIGAIKKALSRHSITDEPLKEVQVQKRPRINLGNAYVHTNLFTMNKGYQMLKHENSTNWNLVKYIETKPKYISTIRAIKRKLKVGFIDVIGAAICASFKDYVVKRNNTIHSFTLGSVVRVHRKEVQEIISKRYTYKELSNTSSGEIYTLSIGSKDDSMTEKILTMHRSSNSLKNSLDFLFPHLLFRDVFTYLPFRVANFMLEKYFDGASVGITNLVGFDKSSFFDCSIDDIYFCVPCFLQIGFTFCIFSYENRLSIALQSNKGYVQSREELQTILDNTLKYLDEAEREILLSAA